MTMSRRHYFLYFSYVFFSLALTIFCIKVVYDLAQIKVLYGPISDNLDQSWRYCYNIQQDILQIVIIVISLVVAALASSSGKYKARIVWLGVVANIAYINCLLAIHTNSLLFFVIMLLFIVSIITSLLSMETDRIRFVFEQRDHKFIYWGLVGYVFTAGLALAVEYITGGINVGPIFFYPFVNKFYSQYIHYSWAISIFIISSFLFAFFLILRRVVWGYVAAVILLLANYDGIVSIVAMYESCVLVHIVPIEPSDLLSLEKLLQLWNILAIYTLLSLAYVSSFVAIFLAYFILKRMREEPIRKT
jgi:hypothetical protein